MRVLVLLLAWAGLTMAQTLEVVHKKWLWPDGKGVVEITPEHIAFKAAKEKNSRTWRYPDIQYFDRVSEKEFVILSYEDQRLELGRDRPFRFEITSGELGDALFESIRQRLRKPATNRVVRDIPAGYELSVKHLHSLGGCEGRLTFTADRVAYITPHRKDAREWRLATDIESVWSMHPYHLEFHVYDNNQREFSRTRVYKFQLKQPLDAGFYQNLKLQMYRLQGDPATE